MIIDNITEIAEAGETLKSTSEDVKSYLRIEEKRGGTLYVY